MYSIKMYGIKAEDKPYAIKWAKEHDVQISMTEKVINEDTIDDAKGFDGVNTLQVTAIPHDAYARLKAMGINQIAQRSAGFDMYDLAEATRQGIIISNVPSYSPALIAEYALTSALNLVRRVPTIQKRVQAHNFTWEEPARGQVVGEMKVAILGTGHIGAHVACLFHGLGSKVIAYDRHPRVDLNFITYMDSIEAAVKDADIVTLHIPLRNENVHLFDAKMFKRFKHGAYLVNTARGGLVDTKALLEALDSGQLGGAALDVYENEGSYVPKNMAGQTLSDELFQKVLNHEKIIYSPHVAFYTDEAVANLIYGGLDATLDVITHGDTPNRVNAL